MVRVTLPGVVNAALLGAGIAVGIGLGSALARVLRLPVAVPPTPPIVEELAEEKESVAEISGLAPAPPQELEVKRPEEFPFAEEVV